MSMRWPDLELLRPRTSDLIPASPLSQARARDAMVAALQSLRPALAHLNDNGPDAAIIDALAACIQVMGFYHDRFLTESKLGSAQLIDDLGKVVALIGYRPLPAVAATACQFFEALTAGIVEAHTQVAASVAGAPLPVVFETTTRIEVAPAHNRMALSPLVTSAPGALRAIITQPDGGVLPSDDFRPETLAMIADAQGLELAPVSESRSRGIAFDRALSRSYEQASTAIARTTVLRHLRFPRTLTLAGDLIAFEVSEAPILHLPSVAHPELVTSTLEIFILRPGDDARDPSEWDPTLRFTEVADFSASEAADLHYRTFLDDAAHTWIILRAALGAQPLLDTAALSRVYARFQPAIGAAPALTTAPIGLEPTYFTSSLVLPGLADRRPPAAATWALADRDLGLVKDDAILIQDANGSSVRTLIDRPPGASPRLLTWAEPIARTIDLQSAKIGSLTDAAAGDPLPTWSELYARLPPLRSFANRTDLPIQAMNPLGVLGQQRMIAAGTTYLVVRDASHITAGDYLLLGRRLTETLRQASPAADWRWTSSEPVFDPGTPWLTAEVLQAVEVRGNVVRLATPVSQDYFVDHGRIGEADPVALSELIVLPGVSSVASGDQLRQDLTLSTQASFKSARDGMLYETAYRIAALDRAVIADDLRRPLHDAGASHKQDQWDTMFLAIAGAAEAQSDAEWTLEIIVRRANLRAPVDAFTRLEDRDGTPLTKSGIAPALKAEHKLALVSTDAGRRIATAKDHGVVAVLAQGPVWTPTTAETLASNQFWILDQASFDLAVTAPAPDPELVGEGATLAVIPAAPDSPAFTFVAGWDVAGNAPRVQAPVPAVSAPFEAVLVSSQGANLAELTTDDTVADWRVPAARFTDLMFAAERPGTLVAVTDGGDIVADCRFAPVGDELVLDDVRVTSNHDPLRGAAAAWAVVPRMFAQLTARARWVYTLGDGDPPLPAAANVRLALIGERRELVDARTRADGRTAVIDPEPGVRDRDLRFPLDQVCVLEGEPVAGAQITASTIWTWRGVAPALAELPEPAHARFVAILAGAPPLHWARDEVWWDAARQTLRLPIVAPDARPADVVRLLEIFAPTIDRRELAIHYDLTTDRSLVTLAMPHGWPSAAAAPAPVVVAIAHEGEHEVHDLIAPIETARRVDGRVTWTLALAGDVRTRWRGLSLAVRDWAAPAERGLRVEPAWRVPAQAATGAVTVVVTLRDDSPFLALAALARAVDGGIELAPLGVADELPPAAAVDSVAIAVHTQAASAAAPLALRGSTVLLIDDAIDSADTPPIIAAAFEDGARWQPIAVRGSAPLPNGGRRFELDRAYVSLFPEGLPVGQRVRLCYATTPVVPGAATPHTLRLRLPGTAWPGLAAANAVVFRHAADRIDGVVLDSPSPPRQTSDAVVIELAITADDLVHLFDADGAVRWTRLDLAQRWKNLHADALVAQPLRVALGGSPPLAPGDIVMIGFPDLTAARVAVLSADQRGIRLDTLAAMPPTEIRLHGLRTNVAPTDYIATLDLAPTSMQAPWLFSFDNGGSPASLFATLLPYDFAPAPLDNGARLMFQFSTAPAVVDIFRRAADPDQPLYLLVNQRHDLRRDFYTGVHDKIAQDLAASPEGAPVNFIDKGGKVAVQQLVMTAGAWALRQLDAPRPALVCSTQWKPADAGPRMPAAQFPEFKLVRSDLRRVATGLVVQSTRWSNGNFIAAASQGTTPAAAAAITASALRVSAQPLDRDGNPLTAAWTPVTFVSLDQLSTVGKTPSSLAAFESMTYDAAVSAGLLSHVESKYEFSASFSPTGACTLHFLFIDKAIVDGVRVRIEAPYDVHPGRAGDGLHNPIYPLETAVAAFDPVHQLALLAPSQLKPGDLLFVRVQQAPGTVDLQWTTVASVTGPLVNLATPLAYNATAVSEPIAVTGIGKLPAAAKLDADYYTTVSTAKLALGAPLVVALRDRLPLAAARVSALIPGDRVLVFDERWRTAWAEHRAGAAATHSPAVDWRQWPDHQYEAVIKRVDPDSGLIVLTAPLPDSVQIRWTYDPATGRLAALDEDIAALRVLPHYRAPVQGDKRLIALGSGSSQKFARFSSSLDAEIGSAVLPVDADTGFADGVTTGNLEVLAFDPVKAMWTRWLRFDRLSRAGKKDPAVLLGFRPAMAGQIPVSVTFGDGVTGMLPPTGSENLFLRSTQIGAAKAWLAAPRDLRVVAFPAPGAAPAIERAASLSARLETAAPNVLSGANDLGSAQWRSSLTLTVTRSDGAQIALGEVSLDDAAAGAIGFVVVAAPDAPPSTVDAFVYAPFALAAAAPTAQQGTGTRPWTLDQAFYTSLSGPSDLTLTAGARALQLLSTTGLRTGSLLAMFHDDASPPDLVRIAAIDPPTWSATLVDPLPQAYDLARSFIRGNLVQVIQGVVESSTIGSSDGTTRSLRLPLANRDPLLHLVDAAGAPQPDITVTVSGLRWDRVLDFTGQAPTSRVWRLDIDADGRGFVVFGDGLQGAIPPTGRDTITAAVRLGDGANANLAAGAITKLVSGNLAIKSTANITPSAGGSAGDDPPTAREKAFAYTLPSERVVSADDCVRAAIGESGVINAALDPTAPDGTVRLLVAMDDRRVPTAADLEAITRQVTDVLPLTAAVRVDVVPAVQTAVYLVLELDIAPGVEPGDVFTAVTTALGTATGGLFAASAWEVGEPLRLGALYDAVFQVDGVAHARVLWMAGTPLPDGAAPPETTLDVFDPGPTGVVRCDNDPVADPFGRFGTFRLLQRPPEESV
jgi:hypothetical protein